jgi:pantoate--beta-alanine ligase
MSLREWEPELQIIHRLSALRDRLKLIRQDGEQIALVPTMGALHRGHMALIETAKQQAKRVVVSIFVNPRQFGPNEDFASYPRSTDEDSALLAGAKVDLVWMPSADDIYPPGYASTVSVAGLDKGLCGAKRPGHFNGVATIVAKLFNQVRPDFALFGEKDWQQLTIIRRMALDLDLSVDVIGVPTIREADDLALSSRNAYLTKKERKAAAQLPAAMRQAVAEMEAGMRVAGALDTVKQHLVSVGFEAPDYVTLAGAEDLSPMKKLDRPARLLVAARLGKARLIDNMAVNPVA